VALARPQSGAGTLAWACGDYKQARYYHQPALVLYRELDDRAGVAFSINNLGALAMEDGALHEAADLFEESAAVYRALGTGIEARRILYPLYNQAKVAELQGDFAQASGLYDETLRRSREIGNPFISVYVLQGLPAADLALGHTAAAAKHYQEALKLAVGVEFQMAITYSLEGLGTVAVSAREGAAEPEIDMAGAIRAARLFGAAEALREAIGAAMDQTEQTTYDQSIGSIRARLGTEEFAAAWAEGRAMAMEEAVEYALEAGQELQREYGQ